MANKVGTVKLGQNDVTLVGNAINVGDAAPDATLVNTSLQTVKLSDYKGKTLVVAPFLSVDTGVCDAELKHFAEAAKDLGDDVRIVAISVDQPFTQKRWCGAAGVDNIDTLSDHRDVNFGLAWGVLMEETRQLARAVFVVDKEGIVRYKEVLPKVGEQPNFEAALAAVRDVR
ncbi:thiol peroxidase [bacterium]|nr:thiol peroxidase [bacterium]